MPGDLIQVGSSDGLIRIKSDGVVVAGVSDACCCSGGGSGITCNNCNLFTMGGTVDVTFTTVIPGTCFAAGTYPDSFSLPPVTMADCEAHSTEVHDRLGPNERFGFGALLLDCPDDNPDNWTWYVQYGAGGSTGASSYGTTVITDGPFPFPVISGSSFTQSGSSLPGCGAGAGLSWTITFTLTVA